MPSTSNICSSAHELPADTQLQVARVLSYIGRARTARRCGKLTLARAHIDAARSAYTHLEFVLSLSHD